MGWAVGFDSRHERDIGYGVPATCDHPGCGAAIDRGLAYVCGGEPPCSDGRGCGLFFCYAHLYMSPKLPQLCKQCLKRRKPFEPTPDVQAWIDHKATDPSWAAWREEQAAKSSTPLVGHEFSEEE